MPRCARKDKDQKRTVESSSFAIMLVFRAFPQRVYNGWALEMLGTFETIDAGAVVVYPMPLNKCRYRRISRKP